MLELAANDPIIKAYLKDIHHLKDQLVAHELGLKAPFHNLLDKAAKKRGWTLVAELSTYSGGKRDEFRLARGWWEAIRCGKRVGQITSNGAAVSSRRWGAASL